MTAGQSGVYDLAAFPGADECWAFHHQAEIVVVDEPRHIVGTQALAVT